MALRAINCVRLKIVDDENKENERCQFAAEVLGNTYLLSCRDK